MQETDESSSSSSEDTLASHQARQKRQSKTQRLQTRILTQLTQMMEQMMKKTKKTRRRRAGSTTTTEDQLSSADSEVILNFKEKKEDNTPFLPSAMTYEEKEDHTQFLPSAMTYGEEEETNEVIPQQKYKEKNQHVNKISSTPKSTKYEEEKEDVKTTQHDNSKKTKVISEETKKNYAEKRPYQDTSRSSINRPTIMPDKYDGTSDWKEYVAHFKSCQDLNSWSDKEAAKFLAASLRGQALRLLEEQRNASWSYEEIQRKLSTRFSSAKQAESYLLELRHRKRRPNESLQELGRNIRELTCRAYPDFDTNGVDRLAKIHFADAIINQEIRTGIFHAKANTLDDMIQAAITTEAFLQTEQHRNGWRRNTQNRVLASDEPSSNQPRLEETEDPIDKLVEKAVNKAMRRIEEKLTLPTQNRPTSNNQNFARQPSSSSNDMKCFYCNRNGHLKRDCRQRIADSRPPMATQGEYPRSSPNRRHQSQLNDQWPPHGAMARPNHAQ